MKNAGVLVAAVVLAIGSIGFARYHHLNKNSATVSNPFGQHETTTVTNPFVDKSLFGDWMKDEWPFAIALPIAFLAAGLVLAVRR
jgi:hypothetical protein